MRIVEVSLSDTTDGYTRLAAEVLLRAARDARAGKADAIAWLQSEGAEIFYDAFDIPPVAGVSFAQRMTKKPKPSRRRRRAISMPLPSPTGD